MAVYFIRAATGEIKIGHAKDPLKRLNDLQTGQPAPLRLLATMPGGVEVERELHDRFAEFHLQGEWFFATERLLGFIEGLVYAADTKEIFDELVSRESHDALAAEIARDQTYGLDPFCSDEDMQRFDAEYGALPGDPRDGDSSPAVH